MKGKRQVTPKQQAAIVEYEKALDAKKKSLAADKDYAICCERLVLAFQQISQVDPKFVERLFQGFAFPTAFKRQAIERFRQDTKDENTRTTFDEYCEFVARFQVIFRRVRKRPFFVPSLLPPLGHRFRAKVADGHLVPFHLVAKGENDPYFDQFETADVAVPSAAHPFVQNGTAKFVLVEDNGNSSILNELEGFAYDPNCLTFVVHRAEQPYLICIVGEKVGLDSTWRDAAKVIRQFRKQEFGRETAGRPPNTQLRKKALKAIATRGALKAKAARLSPTVSALSLETNQQYLSRLKAKLSAPRTKSKPRT